MEDKVCRFHPDREAVSRCATCFKPLCPECVKTVGGQDFCSQTCADNCTVHAERIEQFSARAESDRKRRLRRKRLKRAVWLLFLVVLAGVAWYTREVWLPFVDRLRESRFPPF